MFIVKTRREAACIGCGKEKDCYEVECQKGTLAGPLCPRCFDKETRMRSKNGHEPTIFDKK